MLVWYGVQQRDFLFFLRRKHLIPLGVFVGILLITAGPLVFSLLLLNARDPLWGVHSPVKSSLDLLAPIIHGGHWYFAQLTEPFWSHLTVNMYITVATQGSPTVTGVFFTALMQVTVRKSGHIHYRVHMQANTK